MFEKYKMKDGDTVESIANKYNTTIKNILDLNGMYSIDNIENNREILVPNDSKEYYNYYVVNSGDSLYGIAKRYNINPELLAAINGIEMNDYIYPQQQLLIPKSGYSYYITADGDTIDEVLKIFNSNMNKFLTENDTIYLLSGQLLVNKKE